MKLGIYGGTFSPPHLGHMTSARLALERLGLDKLLFIPTAIPPHKQLPEVTPPAQQRLDMTALAVDALRIPDKVEVSDLELRRGGKSYTADTLEELHREHPGDELWFLMGSDMLLSLHSWYHPERICALARLAAFARHAGEREKLEQAADQLRRDFHATVEILDLDEVVDISSTQLRSGLSRGEGRGYLYPSVYGYILRNGLYGTHADLKELNDEDLLACSLSMVKAKRHAHIQGVAQEAVQLARRWGADEHLAHRAGILHDCTKYLELDEQLRICKKYGIVLDDLERVSVKLLHSKTGAALAKHLYGEPEEVCQAIYYHTTGRADMTLLEKVIYLADYIEPNRDFPGLEELRKLCYTDLDAGLTLAFRMSVEELEERGVPVHTNTHAALEWMLQNKERTR